MGRFAVTLCGAGVGGDHRGAGRTYASVAAIQRTEIYEWAQTASNSQYLLPAFQPYKLQYAMHLIDHGRVTEALNYCNAVLQCLKRIGHLSSPLQICQMHASNTADLLRKYHEVRGLEVDGGEFSAGKVLSSIGGWFDKGINKIMGAPEAPLPSDTCAMATWTFQSKPVTTPSPSTEVSATRPSNNSSKSRAVRPPTCPPTSSSPSIPQDS